MGDFEWETLYGGLYLETLMADFTWTTIAGPTIYGIIVVLIKLLIFKDIRHPSFPYVQVLYLLIFTLDHLPDSLLPWSLMLLLFLRLPSKLLRK